MCEECALWPKTSLEKTPSEKKPVTFPASVSVDHFLWRGSIVLVENVRAAV